MTDPLAALHQAADREFTAEEDCLAALDAAEAAAPLPAEEAIRARLPEKGMTVGLHRLLARVLDARGESAEADRILLGLAERINQAGYWKALAHVATSLLPRHAREAAPLLARARSRGGAPAVPDALLEVAHRALPRHGLLAWQTAEALLAAGREPEARRVAIHALPELVADKNYEMAEEALLVLADDDQPETLHTLAHVIDLLGKQEAWGQLATVLDVTQGLMSTPAGAALAWPVLRDLWLRHPDREEVRRAALASARATLELYPDPAALVRISEMDRPSQPPEVILERLRRALRFPPGFFARHATWGMGLVRENDTEALIIDFPAKPLHRMTYATAEKALDAFAPEDLRVLIATQPEGLKRQAEEDRPGLVVLALRTLPENRGTAEEIRRTLVPAVLASTAWTAWWKGTRAQITASSAIDTSRAYENVYALAGSGAPAETIPLPTWGTADPVIENLARLDSFLDHHPAERPRLLEALGLRVMEAGQDATLKAEDRVAALLWLERLDPARRGDPEALLLPSFDMNALAREDQTQLLGRLTTSSALAVALDSRLTAVREVAWERLRDRADAGAAALDVLEGALLRPEAALHLLALPAEEAAALGMEDWAGRALLAFLDLVERPPRETHRKRAMALAEAGSSFAHTLGGSPLSPALESEAGGRLKDWTSSDRYRFPILEFLRLTGHHGVANLVEGHRARAAARLGNRIGADEDPFFGDTLLTRPTLDRLEGERRRIGMELKTTIPAAIKKARELGDLRENAEYDAAKNKQREYARRFEEMGRLLERIRLIETLSREPGVALPGTQVSLDPAEADAPPLVLWLLGEGDQDLGEGVVSYKAPVGRALTGRRVGEDVVLPWGEAPRQYRIREVVERLP